VLPFSLGRTRQARAECKLPALYLLDSVAKNIRAVYAPLFARNLPEIYIRALEAAPTPGVRTSLEHLRATWKDVFPAVRERAERALLLGGSRRRREWCVVTRRTRPGACANARRRERATPCGVSSRAARSLARSLKRTLRATK
jgi:hypothetical protein